MTRLINVLVQLRYVTGQAYCPFVHYRTHSKIQKSLATDFERTAGEERGK